MRAGGKVSSDTRRVKIPLVSRSASAFRQSRTTDQHGRISNARHILQFRVSEMRLYCTTRVLAQTSKVRQGALWSQVPKLQEVEGVCGYLEGEYALAC